jgi:hypothetical protein
MGMITSSGWVNLLSGRIRLNELDLAPLHGACPRIRWAAVPAGWAAHAACSRGGQLGRAIDSAEKLNLNKKSFFFFQIYFINYKLI